MLVLTRKSQELIHIGDNITIRVVRIKGNTVRIGIEAPKDVRVMRGENVAADATESAVEFEAVGETVASPQDRAITLPLVGRRTEKSANLVLPAAAV